MKKLMLVASLCVVAAVVAPITSASAGPGACKIVGTAEFKKGAGALEPLPFAEPAQRGYKFTAVPGASFAGAGTSGCIEGGVEKKLESASVEGEGEIACVVANGAVGVKGTVTGTGKVKIGAEPEKEFFFKFVAAGANVAVVITEKGGDGVNATGDAQFLTPGEPSEKAKRLTECVKSEITKLPFVALVAGTF
jgi:hypothetical protein